MAVQRTYQQIKDAVLKKGHKWFENGDYNLNLIFVREDDFTNQFTDTLHVCYNKNGVPSVTTLKCSTDAGDYYIFHKVITHLGIRGTAVKKEGQNLGCYTFDDSPNNFHKSPALLQTKPVWIYRDNIYNRVLNKVQEQFGLFGVNTHRATGRFLWNWSAGCFVVPDDGIYSDYDILVDLLREATKRYGNKFTETILEAKDFK